MPTKGGRIVPEGFVKTSFEVSEAAKYALEDLKTSLRRDGYHGLAEAAIVEALIMAAKKQGVDEAVLAKVLKGRKAAQERAEKPRR